jgi:hypothetical protein
MLVLLAYGQRLSAMDFDLIFFDLVERADA